MWKHHVYMEQVADVGGSGTAAPEASAPQPEQSDATGGSLLAQGQQGAVAPLHEAVPEKFRVFKGEGDAREFDQEASFRKTLQSYGELEKHRGNVGDVPKTAEEYAPKVEIEGFDFEAFKADDTTKDFLKGAHAKGMTNDQVSYVLDRYMRTAPELVQAAKMLDAEHCSAELKKVWNDEPTFTKNLGGAFRAFQTYADKAGVTLQEAESAGIANNPVFLRLMASIAPELQEDTGTHGGGASVSNDDIGTLMASDAYRNPKHPEHAKTSERVKAYYAKKFPGAAL